MESSGGSEYRRRVVRQCRTWSVRTIERVFVDLEIPVCHRRDREILIGEVSAILGSHVQRCDATRHVITVITDPAAHPISDDLFNRTSGKGKYWSAACHRFD